MKNSRGRNWSFQRLVRLILGLAVVIQGISEGDWMVGLVGAAFTAMAFFNIGCCGTSGCDVPSSSHSRSVSKEVSYEEVVN